MAKRRKNLLVTGRPGSGKTTVVRRVVERLGGRVGGFFTEEVREGRERVGFRIVTTDGETAVLSHVSMSSPHRVGKYRVNPAAMEEIAVPALRRALECARLIVIDEIAKMELFSQAFQDAVMECLDSDKPVLAVIQMADLPFLRRVRAREDVEILQVTAANREALPSKIVERLQERLPADRAHRKPRRT